MRIQKKVVWCGWLVGFLAACSSMTAVSRTELSEVVEREGIAFVGTEIPVEVIQRLASQRLVIVGETHLIQEHDDFMIALLDSLYERGFRQLLLESPHMVDWVVDEYVAGADNLDWEPPGWFYFDIIHAVRAFNATVPASDRIHMRSIDVNLSEYGGSTDFRGMVGKLSRYLSAPGPLRDFLSAPYGTASAQRESVASLLRELETREADLRALWGDDWYAQVRETMDVEAASVEIRAIRDSDYDRSVRRREREMKRLADARLRDYPHRSLVNVGATHAQKERLQGTDIEWLGDYLVHESTAVGGSIMVLCVTAAEIVSRAGSGLPDFTVMEASPDNEIWRLMTETWPERNVFLPLDDPIFRSGVRINFEGIIHTGAPKRHYDALLQFGVAHRQVH